MKHFRLVDNLMGWLAFAIAAFVYCSTIEPTASFWDCPEFITTGYKLEVGHPPGAPFFMLTANFFSQFVSDPTQVAMMVNMMSALFSAACIMFLFWSISHLTRKLICEKGWVKSTSQLIAIEASGMVGALAYCFSDTFWFSAVEGEVYAYSSLFTAVVFWLMLKWEDNADKPGSDRWLILIAYLTGLSIGVHLLNLLCVPALVLVYYYRKAKNPTWKGAGLAFMGSGALVAAVLYGIVPGIVKMGGWFELLFVNGLGFSFNTGLIIYIVLLFGCVVWALWETTKQRSRTLINVSFALSVILLGIPFYGYGASSIVLGILFSAALCGLLYYKRQGKELLSARLLNTTLLCMLMIMIGYSSYAVIVIRSSANTPMDQDSPEDIFTLGTYLNREQYGDRPLFYGQAFTSERDYEEESDGQYVRRIPKLKEKAPIYVRKEKASADEKDSYTNVNGSGEKMYKQEIVYKQNMLFPRMYSSDPRHIPQYKAWSGCGDLKSGEMPSQWENLKFFKNYQCDFMYWRYFMWNFAGRQNDIQCSYGELDHGNWLSGIPFIDNARLGDQDKLPEELKNNKGHNVYYCLPLLLGLIGLFWQMLKNNKENNNEGGKQFSIVFLLFFMTGLAIVLYLNQTPLQPRERDYAYAGSFYAFAIWIGLGVAAIIDGVRRLLKNQKEMVHVGLNTVIGLVCLLVPIQMASQNWDDHDRSDRYTCRDFGQNYLESLSKEGNPIIFTNGDNDTFPLWYAQETEGFRTDARVCNLSYLQTDWYIDQMKRPAYDSPALPIHFTRMQYLEGTRDYVLVQPGLLEQAIDYYKQQGNEASMRAALGDDPYDLRNIMEKWVLNDNMDLQCFPTDHMHLKVDKEAVLRSGMMIAGDSIPDYMDISLEGKQAVFKSELMIYELLAQCNWERPLYVAISVGADNYGNLGNNFVQEGLANRITPFNTKATGLRTDTDKMYENFMKRFKFGGIDNPDIYLDETVMRMCHTHRHIASQLAYTLIAESRSLKAQGNQAAGEAKLAKALEVLQYSEKMIPDYNVPYNELMTPHTWLTLIDKDTPADKAAMIKKKAEEITLKLMKTTEEYINYYLSLPDGLFKQHCESCLEYFQDMENGTNILKEAGSPKAVELSKRFEEALQQYSMRCQVLGVDLFS